MTRSTQHADTLPQVGQVAWIGLSPEKRGDIQAVEAVYCRVGTGLDGDHHARKGTGKRQVTLIQAEHLGAIASMAGLDGLNPEQLRRNLVVGGINLLALQDKVFRVGEATLRGTGLCEPCHRMEENLGPGGYNAMNGHGGIHAEVLTDGWIQRGDRVWLGSEAADDEG